MKNSTILVALTSLALAAGCGKSATVQGEPVKKTETETTRKESKGADYDKEETKTVVKETELPTKLTLDQPSSLSLERGGTGKCDVKIKRENLSGDVSFRFSQLPAGVTVVDPDQRLSGDNDKCTFTFKAANDAGIVKSFQAQVTAVGSDGIAVSQPLEISVKDRK